MRVIVFIVVYIGVILGAHAQDLSTDLKDISSELENSTSSHLRADISIYKSHTSKDVSNSMFVELIKLEDYAYFNSDNYQTCINDKHSIVVYKPQKQMIVRKNEKSKPEKLEGNVDLTMFDTLDFKKPSVNVKFLGEKNGIKQYSIDFKSGVYTSMMIFLNSTDKKLISIELRYNTSIYKSDNKVLISYAIFKTNTSVKQDIFKDNYYFTKSRQRLTPAARFSGFNVVDYDEF